MRSVGAHRNDIIAGFEEARQLVAEAGIARRMEVEVLAVDPHARAFHNAVELDENVLARGIGRQREMLAIPGDTRRQPGAGTGRDGGLIERALDFPVIGQIDLLPTAVAEGRALGPGEIALLDQPVLVERHRLRVGRARHQGQGCCARQKVSDPGHNALRAKLLFHAYT